MELNPLKRRWSPPPYLEDLETFDLPVLATDNSGMIIDPVQNQQSTATVPKQLRKRKRRTLQYVSHHFVQAKEPQRDLPPKKRRKVEDSKDYERAGTSSETAAAVEESDRTRMQSTDGQDGGTAGTSHAPSNNDEATVKMEGHVGVPQTVQDVSGSEKGQETVQLTIQSTRTGFSSFATTSLGQEVAEPLPPPQQHTPHRIFFGLDVDALSSDSDLTDVPHDIGPDPFLHAPRSRLQAKKRRARKTRSSASHIEVVAVKEKKTKPKLRTGLTKSPYFPHAHKARPTFLSTLPFPPLHLDRFGLMQERLCHDPFRLLLATIFLNKTPGARAMPIFFKLMEKYPTPEKLGEAEQADVTNIIHELGFQNQRAAKCIAMAKRWVQDPPVKGRRWRKKDYPVKGDGKDVKSEEIIDDEDTRVAWEISHLPGLGPYSHDSWRMFCRDELRGLASAYNGEDAQNIGDKHDFEPEWKRVLPTDKELRAWMTWMWMKEGFVWNKETGQKTRASDELMELARGKDNIVLESGANTLQVKSLNEDQPSPMKLAGNEKADVRIEAPAGDFVPAPG